MAACYSLAEYDSDVIKKHERTRKDKEDDRTRHIVELRAQTGPVFLAHRPNRAGGRACRGAYGRPSSRSSISRRSMACGTSSGRLRRGSCRRFVEAFASVDALYIADGHHRAASAARARDAVRDSDEANYFLAVAFPSDQLRILPYNRVVRDLKGMTPRAFSRRGRADVRDDALAQRPRRAKGEVSMYVAGAWYTLDLESAGMSGSSVIDRLDGNVLQERLLTPILGIQDVRTDERIDFVGGAKGTHALEQLVDSGKMAVAFSMYPVSLVGADGHIGCR